MKQLRYLLIFTLLILICTAGSVQGYIITIDAPKTIVKGSPLTVTGSTSFSEDSYFDLVLFYSKYTAAEMSRIRVIVDKTQLFRVDFDTRHLQGGQYKVEVQNIISDNELFVEQQLGSSSIIMRIVQITDRSNEITITSPPNQPLSQALTISGKMKGIGDGVLTIRVFGPEQFTYGPEQVITKKGFADNSGDFSTTAQVSSPGEYQVCISDKNGYIGEYPFVISGQTPDKTPSQKTEPTINPMNTTEITTNPTEASVPLTPTPTQAPLTILSIITGVAGVFLITGKRK